ncbi:MAG TPA: DUF2844 domain-containing protein [Casimicrobiaceae bacterium]|nr:DUF2844 domain-containing protein [Casimicrobiaceae bacterium]
MNDDSRCAFLRRACLAGLSALLSAATFPAHAALGAAEASIQADQQQMGATQRVLRPGPYTVHEMQAPSGTVVRQYVSPQGMVYGVAWQGPAMPDLRQLLGAYFQPYIDAVAQRKARGPVVVEQPGLVVHSSGHMRAFAGRAYIPEALPEGVTADSVK